MLRNKAAYKYKTSYKVPHEMTQTCTNVTTTLQKVAEKKRLNIKKLKPYKTNKTLW